MSLRSYANTTVGAGRSKEQIELLLKKVGAIGFNWVSHIPFKEDGEGIEGLEQLNAMLRWQSRKVSLRLSIRWVTDKQQRQNLRALYWYLKAKIEAIEFGIVDLEQEFMPYMLAPSGQTLYDELGGAHNRLLAAPVVPAVKED